MRFRVSSRQLEAGDVHVMGGKASKELLGCGEVASLLLGAYVGVGGGAGPRSERPWVCVDACIGVRPGGVRGSGWHQAGTRLPLWGVL